jgi:hypothetical protein
MAAVAGTLSPHVEKLLKKQDRYTGARIVDPTASNRRLQTAKAHRTDSPTDNN